MKTMEKFNAQYHKFVAEVDSFLHNHLKGMKRYPKTIFDSIEYSLFAGGKRLRPVLLLASHILLGGNTEESLPLAGALEMIHTYSLIHDDLPSMDNDDFRRGKPTNHKVFGQGMAILTGDALLNLAYETMLDNALVYPEKFEGHIKAINTIARAAGIRGMIGGQVVDLESEGKEIGQSTLEFIHDHKTGSLMLAPLEASIALENPPAEVSNTLVEYGQSLGLAFQVIDDILDVVGEDKTLGKKTGSDKDKNKATYVAEYGLDKSWNIAKNLCNYSMEQMATLGAKGEFLKNLARFIIKRDN